MTAFAESFPFPVRTGSPSSRSSLAAIRIEYLADRSLVELKHRAHYLRCLNEIEEIKSESAAGGIQLNAVSYQLGLAFVYALPSTVKPPEVMVDLDGELIFDWRSRNGRLLSVCAQSNGRLAYAIRYSASRAMHGYCVMDQTVPKEIMDAINGLGQ
jgi:hypothetical protein